MCLPVAMALVFWRQLIEFRDPFAPWTEDAELLLRQTAWGRMWMWATVAAVMTPLAFFAASDSCTGSRMRGVGWVVATVLTAALCTFPAYSGHAAGTAGLRWLSLPADSLHVLGAGSWMGGLLFVVLADRSWRRHTGTVDGSLLPALVPLFSPIAMVSVGVMVATGTLGAWLHVASVGALFTTSYGRLLTAKIVLVLAVLSVGALNWKRLTPRLGDPDGPAALRRTAVVELILAHLVIIVTAVLVRTSPLHDWSWSNLGH